LGQQSRGIYSHSSNGALIDLNETF
jgi:hypothetical protein